MGHNNLKEIRDKIINVKGRIFAGEMHAWQLGNKLESQHLPDHSVSRDRSMQETGFRTTRSDDEIYADNEILIDDSNSICIIIMFDL